MKLETVLNRIYAIPNGQLGFKSMKLINSLNRLNQFVYGFDFPTAKLFPNFSNAGKKLVKVVFVS